MARAVRILLSILAVLLIVPGWTGAERLPLVREETRVAARPFVPDRPWPARIGALVPVGAVRLSARDPAFGGWSAMSVRGGDITLMSDGGNYVRFALARGEATTLATDYPRVGPGTGWGKSDRDAESLAVDPVTGTTWIGYERANAIWRYAPGFARATGHVRPRGMRGWRANDGSESLVRLADGRFLVIAERSPNRRRRAALLFDRDPVAPGARVARFFFRPPAGYDPSDAVQLPDGDLLVLVRRYRFPLRFDAKLVRVPVSALRRGAMVEGREIATLSPPWFPENCEALSVTVERGATYLWIATDNDSSWFRPNLLYKLRLAA